MANFLVTGGCGFIGSHLADALIDAGHGVRILDDLSTGKRKNAPAAAEIVVGTITDAAAVAAAMAGMDGCFHLAAIASVQKATEEWAAAHRINLTGTIHVFDAARRARAGGPIPVVYASSAAVYGDNPDAPLTETAELRPLSAYGADKLGCELHGRVAAHVHGVANTGFRIFNCYGPRQDPSSPYSGVISIFARCVVADRELVILGDGGQTRDFVFVADVVRAFLAGMAAAAAGRTAVYNVCTGRPTTIERLAAMLAELAGRAPRIRHGEARPGDIRISLGDGSKAAAALDFRPRTPLDQGLARVLETMAAEA